MNTEELIRLHEAATPGPWEVEYDDYGDEIWFGGSDQGTWTVGPFYTGRGAHIPERKAMTDADASLVAFLRNSVPEIIAMADERDRLRAENAKLKGESQ